MQINVNQSSSNQVELEQSSTSKASQQNTTSSSNANVVDRASLTNDSTTVTALQQQAMSVPDVRQEKVDALKQQVQSGQYNHDPASTAKAMRENGL